MIDCSYHIKQGKNEMNVAEKINSLIAETGKDIETLFAEFEAFLKSKLEPAPVAAQEPVAAPVVETAPVEVPATETPTAPV